MPTTPVRPHGARVRGATLSRGSALFGGPFGRILRALPPADFGPDDFASIAALTKLATSMVSVADPADPKDGPDPEEGGIPSAFTYFGQFIDHDLHVRSGQQPAAPGRSGRPGRLPHPPVRSGQCLRSRTG